MRFCASARTFTSLASRNALRCWEMAGGDSSNCPRDVAGAERAAGQHLDDALAGGIGQGGEMDSGHATIFRISLN